ncbi:MAG: hypothetical protein ABSC19_06095 [Syntrophorhabdales bacterium]|jgi:hypothetical protein
MSGLDEIQAIVNESGNSFHSRVANYLKEKEWHTLVSPYYMDNATNKAREIDLIAEKAWIRKDDTLRGRKYGAVVIKLFIECKYIPQANVFWFSNKDIDSAREWVIRNTPLRKDNFYTEKHHYLAYNPKVAKLFASKYRPNTENEVIYKALNQSLNAMVYLRRRPPVNREFREQRTPVLTTVEMPVILCNSFSDFYRVDMDQPGEPEPIEGNFQLEVNYAYLDDQKDSRMEYFLVDIVDFNKFDDYLAVLEADQNAIYALL